MWTWLRRAALLALAPILGAATVAVAQPIQLLGPVYDITHFDVLPITSPFNSEAIAYKALFAFRAASRSDPGYEALRIVNWTAAPNHSWVVDVWDNYQAFEQHLAAPGSVKFRFAVQDLSGTDKGCCIGSPIDDRQYSLVESIPTAWTSGKLPKTPGPKGALWAVIYVDFLQEILQDYNTDVAQQALISYGKTSTAMNSGHLLNYTVLQQLDRTNRYIILEVWDTETNYDAWKSGTVTTDFVSHITPLLGSPLDYRTAVLCGATYKAASGSMPAQGCTSP
jgi:quinol monooxygenase YgiN